MAIVSTARNLFLFWTFVQEVAAAGGRGGARGVGGATGVRTKNREGDETGTLNVILVVILPVAQMILVLMIISILRILYCKYCKKQYDDPKLLQVVSSAKKKNEHQILLKTSIPRLQTDTNGKNKH